jgi:hypothetical protein
MRIEDDVATLTTSEETGNSRKALPVKVKAKRTKPAVKAKKAKPAVKAKKAKRAKTADGSGKRPLNEDRKDKYAAALRIRQDTPRAKLVEHLAANSGKMFSADALAKRIDWERKQVQHFVTVRIPYKNTKYSAGMKVLADGEGNYGLEVKRR